MSFGTLGYTDFRSVLQFTGVARERVVRERVRPARGGLYANFSGPGPKYHVASERRQYWSTG